MAFRAEISETVVEASERDAQQWEHRRGHGIASKTLISRGLTNTRGMTLGTADLEPGGELRRHSHPEAEAYLVVEGTAEIETGGTVHRVGAGGAIHIPGDLPHSCRNAEDGPLRIAYFLSVDSIDDIDYAW